LGGVAEKAAEAKAKAKVENEAATCAVAPTEGLV
jgi:hypothetical protein